MHGQHDPKRDESPKAISTQAEEFSRRLTAMGQSRLAAAAQAAVDGLHALIVELRPSGEEFRQAIDFLTEVGHYADARRQEWVLFADVLGVSSLIEDQNSPRPAGATPNTLAGPFYRADVPEMPPGANISRDHKGEPLEVAGRIVALDGAGVSDATVEIWQANAEGLYENQEPDRQPEFNLRGRFRTDPQGRFRFTTVKPKGYTLPSDGPVGQLMSALGLGLERPAHIHFRVSAEDFETLTTHIFDRSDPAIGRDAIFGVKPELMAEFRALPPNGGKRKHALDLNLVLCPQRRSDTETSGRR
ncbi:dioxygenase [Mesorhizobium ciceri]|uniref:Intradiol ring-cleavage dioxygenase n=1 Tax=Mesorhizobium ciceri biovar biserrulae (strain HAMBI 2942 / LMG 23838 / WSM1271) TaxID=765698 RepID=E8TCE1_MESCW|nr:dioxygenase [Mesorhizobium ciceri]ADV14449.1 intradiol ring-cleavage dioxygenase [Mesorhizobium ciceri biovar biserrulae WSM1271]